MKKRGLAILIAVLGVLCVVCGALLLLQGNPTPVTAEPSPSSTVEATARTGGNTGACQFPAGNGGALRQPYRFCLPSSAKPGHLRLAAYPGHGV